MITQSTVLQCHAELAVATSKSSITARRAATRRSLSGLPTRTVAASPLPSDAAVASASPRPAAATAAAAAACSWGSSQCLKSYQDFGRPTSSRSASLKGPLSSPGQRSSSRVRKAGPGSAPSAAQTAVNQVTPASLGLGWVGGGGWKWVGVQPGTEVAGALGGRGAGWQGGTRSTREALSGQADKQLAVSLTQTAMPHSRRDLPTYGHVRSLLSGDPLHNGCRAVVAHPHQPLEKAVTSIQPPGLLREDTGQGRAGRESLHALHYYAAPADSAQPSASAALPPASATSTTAPFQYITPHTPMPHHFPYDPPHPYLRHGHNGQARPQVPLRRLRPLPQQVVGGHAAIAVPQLAQALQAPRQVAALLIRCRAFEQQLGLLVSASKGCQLQCWPCRPHQQATSFTADRTYAGEVRIKALWQAHAREAEHRVPGEVNRVELLNEDECRMSRRE